MLKLTHGPHLGRITTNAVRVWLRLSGEGYARVVYSPDDPLTTEMLDRDTAVDYQESVAHPAQAADDFIVTIDLVDLSPNYAYRYRVELSEDGETYQAQAIAGTTYGFFRTFPEPGQPLTEMLVFAFGSCIHPYQAGDRIFEGVARQSDQEHGFRFQMLIGDQAYTDLVPKELVPPDIGHWSTPPLFSWDFKNFFRYRSAQDVAAYQLAYRIFWTSLPFRRALMKIPTFMASDDHEFRDSWGQNGENRPESKAVSQRQAALQAYQQYQHALNPATPEAQYWYTFEYGDIVFFVMDTRSERDWEAQQMISSTQMKAVQRWLRHHRNAPLKFIISSVPIVHISSIFGIHLPPIVPATRDQWAGFEAQRRDLLKYIFDREIGGVCFLSGDVHMAHAAKITQVGHQCEVLSFTASPLAQASPVLHEYIALKDRIDDFDVTPIFKGAGKNFGVIRVTPSPEKAYQVDFELHDKQPERFFRYPGRGMVVLDIDRTLSTSSMLKRTSVPYLNAAPVVQRLHQQFGVVYLTARPRFLPYVDMVRDWLRSHGFPASQVTMLMKPWDVLPWRHGIYKDEMIQHMVKHQGHTPVLGIGDRLTDAEAYLKNGLIPLIINVENADLPDGVHIIEPNAELSIWEQIEAIIFNQITISALYEHRQQRYSA